jgi:hypothetical protein
VGLAATVFKAASIRSRSFTDVHESTILALLSCRFAHQRSYTFAGVGVRIGVTMTDGLQIQCSQIIVIL